jgi:potassium-dependent mechanosensitive channel
MTFSRQSSWLALVLCLLVAARSPAQTPNDNDAPAAPNPRTLTTNWWNYFEGPRSDVEAHVNTFLADLGTQISGLEPRNQQTAESLLPTLRDNFSAYLDLLDQAELKAVELPDAAANYTIDELLVLASTAREAQSDAAMAQLEVEREQRTLDGASRRRDAAFKDYIDASPGDERWLRAVRLIQARSAQAISARRLELLTKSYEHASAYAQATTARVEFAFDHLTRTADEARLADLAKNVERNQQAVDKAREKFRAAQIAATGLELDNALGRSQQRLQQQNLLNADVGLALAETSLARAEVLHWWARLVLNEVPDTSALADQALTWSELARDIEQRAPEWKRQTEDELLAVQSVNRDGLDRAARRMLDQRLGTAQQTLAQTGELNNALADLQLLMRVVDRVSAEYSGAFKSWLAGITRKVKTASIRVASLGDVTLFTVGETPVTGGDILRALIIMVIAFLLSRGIRHAIRRVGHSESAGTQASLYTVGRLTHYTIVILAIFIALSSIGLDFSSLALVAGALSVGIGFGLQSIVNNFVSGLIILFEHSLRVGDYIELDTGLTGTVKAINVRSTLINTNDNIDIVVPNSEFVTTKLTNWTLAERTLRVRIAFGVAYGSDKDLVKKAAMEAAAEVPYTLTNMKGREPDVWLVEFGDNSLNFLLLVWVNRQGAKRPTRTRAAYLWALEDKLREYGIEIPYPQRDLHLRSGWPPA